MSDDKLKTKQDAAAEARQQMFDALVAYDPCRELKVKDVEFIADWCRTVTFRAIVACTDD